MEYSEFIKKIKLAMQEYVAEESEVEIREVVKNNGLVLQGLTVRQKSKCVSPTMYLEGVYERYINGEAFGEIMKEIIGFFEFHNSYNIDMEYFSDYSLVKNRIIYKLVNYQMNMELLEDVPYFNWNDLAIVFCHIIEDPTGGNATVLLRNEHLAMWGVEPEEVYKQACENTPLLMKDDLIDMKELIISSMNEKLDAEMEMELRDVAPDEMYVLTNKSRIFGATTVLYSDKIKEISTRMDCNLYIIPSSVHEIIILPDRNMSDHEYMQQMIKDVNATQVSLEERLSDSLYYYSKADDEITIMA